MYWQPCHSYDSCHFQYKYSVDVTQIKVLLKQKDAHEIDYSRANIHKHHGECILVNLGVHVQEFYQNQGSECDCYDIRVRVIEEND